MKILIGFLLALFISGQAIALDSGELLSKGKIIYQTEDSKSSYIGNIKYINFFVLYKKSLWKCESITALNSGDGILTCKEQGNYPVRDKEGKEILD